MKSTTSRSLLVNSQEMREGKKEEEEIDKGRGGGEDESYGE